MSVDRRPVVFRAAPLSERAPLPRTAGAIVPLVISAARALRLCYQPLSELLDPFLRELVAPSSEGEGALEGEVPERDFSRDVLGGPATGSASRARRPEVSGGVEAGHRSSSRS